MRDFFCTRAWEDYLVLSLSSSMPRLLPIVQSGVRFKVEIVQHALRQLHFESLLIDPNCAWLEMRTWKEPIQDHSNFLENQPANISTKSKKPLRAGRSRTPDNTPTTTFHDRGRFHRVLTGHSAPSHLRWRHFRWRKLVGIGVAVDEWK